MVVPTRSQKRPRDRKAQIASSAAQLFRDQGYDRIGVHEIAASVGITGRAIYRHFDNKNELLSHVVSDGVTQLEGAVGGDGESLDDVVRAVVAITLDRRELGVLIQREVRHLAPLERDQLNRRLDAVVAQLSQRVRTTRPGLFTGDADVLARAALAVATSPSHHNVVLNRPAADSLLCAMTSAVLAAELPERVTADRAQALATATRASRREAVLAAAIELFGRNGYTAVRMEDVGGAAGITGPSIYEHFESKQDLLMAALTRGAEWLQLGINQAFATPAAPRTHLERVLRSYVDFSRDHRDLMSVFLSEAIHLPDAERHILRRLQHEYVSEWVQLLCASRSELGSAEAGFLTHGALAIVNDSLARGQARSDAGVLTALGLEVLFT